MSETIQQTSQVLQGQVMNNSHPIHPATVHLPIAFLTAAFVLDTLALFPSILISISSLSILPPVSSFNSIAHYSGAAGILLATPTLITGLGELYEMTRAQAQGKDSTFKVVTDAFKTKDIPGEKLKTTITHATLNDLVIGVAAYNWWTRRKIVNLALPPFNLYLSAISLPIFAYSAYLGGKLVYEYGVGVQRQGRAKQRKKE